MSAFGNKIRELLQRIGENEQWLAEQTGIGKATISEWSSNGDRVPKPSSVRAVVLVFAKHNIAPEEIYEAAGYVMVASISGSQRIERLERLAAANPRILDQMDKLSHLPPQELEEAVRLLEAWHLTRRRQ